MKKNDYHEILVEIKPKSDEIKAITKLAATMMGSINETADKEGIDAQAVLVGSVAKGTWLSGKADVDIFIKFPLETPEDILKEKGLYLGRRCIKNMKGIFEYRYASHPYITGLIEGYKIDFVPCYDIGETKKIKSAVDRTIPHTRYVKTHLKIEDADEVLLLKCFMKTIDTYGSEFKVGGFAGYLCELLILHYKTFLRVLESAADDWKPGYSIDLGGYGTAENFHEHLIVVDPVDPDRNVAAALTLEKMSEFIAASRHFLNNKSISYFKSNPVKVDLNQIKESFRNRATKTLALLFKAPDIPADALYPQMYKTTNSMVRLVERKGFKLYNHSSWTDEKEKIIILLEFEVWNLPTIRKHHGPPVWSRKHSEKFLEKYGDKSRLEGDRWVAEVERENTTAEDLLKSALSRDEMGLLKFGKHIKNNVMDDYELIELESLFTGNLDQEFLDFLYFYLNKSRKYLIE